jgi:hypothetical protein
MASRHMIAIESFEEAIMAAITFNAADHPGHPLLAQPDSRTRIPAVSGMDSNAPFQPLDPDIVSESIPAFFIGRNGAGFWVARESHGRIGGLFLFKSSAVDFAKTASEPSHCALIFPADTFELDIENRGNPLIAQFARWTNGVRRHFVQAPDN